MRFFIGNQEVAGAGGGNRPDERRVQAGEFNFRHFGQARGEAGIDFFGCGYLGKVGSIFHGFQLDAIAAGGEDDIFYRDQLGHVVTRFERQSKA